MTLKEILSKDLSWYDYKSNANLWKTYHAEAQTIANSEIFNNEVNHLIADLTKECATLEGTPLSNEKLIKLTNIQAMILLLETFRQRFNQIEDPNIVESNENVHEPI
jgi:hypothetical protein